MTERYVVEIREARKGDRCIGWTSPRDPAKPPNVRPAVETLEGLVGPVIVENGEMVDAGDLAPLVLHGPGRINDDRYVVTNLSFAPGDELCSVVVKDSRATPTDAGWEPSFNFTVPVDRAPKIGGTIRMSWSEQ